MKKHNKANWFAGSSAAVMGMWLLQSVCAYGQPTNDKLLTFQKFVNGEIPIKEAIVYRTLANTNGHIFNKQWWRFAYQEGSWYCQQLVSDPNDPTNLIPVIHNQVFGKSLSSFWSINETAIEIADKNFVRGGPFEKVFERSLMTSALSLGIPRNNDVLNIEDSYITWDNLQFRSMVVSKRDKANKFVSESPADGRLELGISGAPMFSEHPEAGEFLAARTFYYYTSLADSIPTEFVFTNADCIMDQTFILLKLGKSELKGTNGFVPSMFGDVKLVRAVEVFTNNQSYDWQKGKLVSNAGFIPVDAQKGYGKLVVLLCVVAATSIFLGLWYWNSKKQTK